MNTILWVVQAFLAVAFLYSGVNKSLYTERQLIAKGQTGVVGLPEPMIRFIGISEIAGSAGIILPWWLGIAPFLTPLSASCFALLMVLAAPIHYKLKEPKNVMINMILLMMALFVAFERWGQL